MRELGGPAKPHNPKDIEFVTYVFYDHPEMKKVDDFLNKKHKRASGFGYEWYSKFKPPHKNPNGSVGVLTVTPSMLNNKAFQKLVKEVGADEIVNYFGGKSKRRSLT